VAETENRIDGSQALRRRASVDFPAPEGEDRMISRPRRLCSGIGGLPLRFCQQMCATAIRGQGIPAAVRRDRTIN
jgi:hypothetical protein